MEKTKHKISENEQESDFSRYSSCATVSLFVLFFFMGVINHLGTILVMTGGRLLSADLGMKDYVSVYTSGATVFAIITRLINSKFMLKVSYKKRMIFITMIRYHIHHNINISFMTFID